ncbi:unnamed protein product [Adineta steineri]|uniref:F-box domain-containing protein n=1 Tax=Adineta steineri TaxID=433720 RepID=A0A818KNF9_9BILA|nr:unnamed protein product [Adineta steineri]CAF3558074.1 unnamed protein product [Adineta steineri]CAF3660857.1 unnamed protein product [Adineta steineri]
MKNYLNILDIPDEILFLIFQRLNAVEVFTSLEDVNQRFHRLAFDPLLIRDLNMTTITNINSFYDQNFSIDSNVLSRICKNILPQIHSQVHKLTVEQDSMKEILHAGTYPQLYSLSLINFEEEIIYQYLTDDLVLRDLLTKQITHLNIDMKMPEGSDSETISKIFQLILSLCKNLISLNFCDMYPTRSCFNHLHYLFQESYMPSSLNKLKINLPVLTYCLYLLDGPLVSLSTLIINVSSIFHPEMLEPIDPTKKLPNLKYFSFTSFGYTFEYDNLIVPLLCRMINLEELQLYLSVGRFYPSLIDGNQLYDQFLIYMTQLRKFTFNIKTWVTFDTITNEIPTSEDIQRTFIGRIDEPVAAYVYMKSYPRPRDCVCHVYTLPYDFEYFTDLNNSFQGGMFEKVRRLKMWDTNPFEYKLFKIISQDFPFLEFLYIANDCSQEENQHSSTTITFPNLTLLDLKYAHVDYAKLFLFKQNMSLPRLINLTIKYKSLVTITDNFTKSATLFNFDKLKSLDVCEQFVGSKTFHDYFPLL